ncbi:MAG TPA: carboxypeptidase-like regulatory domain-containing protein [Terriglobales bacterium]|nr:carboxypeptidase-like regulatory domain-containing protein [Terriglobales bacterium]
MVTLALLLCAMVGMAQTNTTGAISGTITDASGASIPGAVITATSVQNGTVFHADTQANGGYIIPLLHPGTYNIVVTHTGFQSAKQGPVTVTVAGNASLNFKLSPGQTSQVVEVTGQAPLLEPENPNTTTTLDAKAIDSLPDPGNDLTFLAQVAPGAVITKGATSPSYIAADYNGLPGTGVNFTIDGASLTIPSWASTKPVPRISRWARIPFRKSASIPMRSQSIKAALRPGKSTMSASTVPTRCTAICSISGTGACSTPTTHS